MTGSSFKRLKADMCVLTFSEVITPYQLESTSPERSLSLGWNRLDGLPADEKPVSWEMTWARLYTAEH